MTREMPLAEWEIWTHKQPRETSYPIFYWARMHDELEGQVEVRKVETNPEHEILPADMMMKGPLFPIEGFLKHYELGVFSGESVSAKETEDEDV